jgi:hypothetical protein
MTSNWDRLLFCAAGGAAAIGALLRVAAAIPSILPDPHAREGLYMAVDLLLLFAIFGLFAHEPRLRRGLGSAGFALAVLGFVLIRTGPRLGPLGDYQAAAAILTGGLAIMGAALWRAAPWARAAGLAWIAALIAGLAGVALHSAPGLAAASLLFCVAFGLAAVALLRTST